MTSLLASKPECERSMVYNSIGFNTRDNREAEDTMTILSFSYYDLPPHLRTCLLYLSTYPKDYEIKKDSLIWKWIAEGFINGDQGTRLFELGERYFNDLINRSLIHVMESEWDATVLGCRVHDMVLDLMRKLSTEENFIAILGDNVEGTTPLSNVHRLAHQNSIAEHINSEGMVTRMPKVRSYTAFMCFIDSRVQILLFKLLRVLDIVDCNSKEGCHFEHLGDLLHLRYLGIRCQGGDDPELPKQIGNLKLMQTLDVHGALPASIVHLTELVWLCAHKKIGIGKLDSLEELIILNGCSDKPKRFLQELGCLHKLRVLVFGTNGMDESMQRDFVGFLSNLQKLQYINLHGSVWHMDTAMWEAAGFVLPRSLHHFELFIYFSKLPSCINPLCLPNLSHLILWVDTMDVQDMKHLAGLPALSSLHLEIKSTVRASNINANGDGCFQKLSYFEINAMVQFQQHNKDDSSCISLHIWNSEGAMPFGSWKSNCSNNVPSAVMPNLEVLDFDIPLLALKDNNDDCGNIGLEYLPSLRELKAYVNCDGVCAEEVDAALTALRNTFKVHPNHPTFYMKNVNKAKMVSTQDKEHEKQQQEAEMASQAVNNIDLGKLSPASS